MKASEIREMSVDELNEKLASLKEELFALRFQLAINQLDNTARLKAVKRILHASRHLCVRQSLLQSSKKGRI